MAYLAAWWCLRAIAIFRSGRWYPDYQLRLYRNIPSLIEFNRRPHERPRIAGEARLLSDSWILHWDPVWYSRARRDQKVAFYWDLGYTKEDYYLHDEEVFQTRPLDYIYPRPSVVAADTSNGSSPFHASLEVLDWPEVLQAGKLEPVLIDVRNTSNRLFRPSSTFVRPANVYTVVSLVHGRPGALLVEGRAGMIFRNPCSREIPPLTL